MGVYPYITAQIIIQLLVPIIPALERRMKENPREGQTLHGKMDDHPDRPDGALSAIGQINIFNQLAGGQSILGNWGFTGANLLPTLATLLSMIAGTMFGIWLGQLISEYGIRNQGLSLIIFAGIVARIPSSICSLLSDAQHRWVVMRHPDHAGFDGLRHRLRPAGPPQRPGDVPGPAGRQPHVDAGKSNLPLMVNMAGMIPLIFAQSILTFPAIVASYFVASKTAWVANLLDGHLPDVRREQRLRITLIYFFMVVVFTFFYTDVLFTQQNYGENLKKQGAQIPGVVRGAPTQKYLTRVQRRITLPGALFLGIVAVLPYILSAVLPVGARPSTVCCWSHPPAC